MPRKPHKTVMKKANEAWILEFHSYGYYTLPSGKKSRMKSFLFNGRDLPGWNDVKNEVLPDFIKENLCKRPYSWWGVDAPERRRRRIGGTGRCTRNPILSFGLPSDNWFKDVDPARPPLYESEAAYLQRHDVLNTVEKKYLAEHPELLEPVEIEYRLETGPEVYSVGYRGPGYYEDSTEI